MRHFAPVRVLCFLASSSFLYFLPSHGASDWNTSRPLIVVNYIISILLWNILNLCFFIMWETKFYIHTKQEVKYSVYFNFLTFLYRSREDRRFWTKCLQAFSAIPSLHTKFRKIHGGGWDERRVMVLLHPRLFGIHCEGLFRPSSQLLERADRSRGYQMKWLLHVQEIRVTRSSGKD
jgi:hypothetical protein